MSAAFLERSPDLVYSVQSGYLTLIPITDTARKTLTGRTYGERSGIAIVGEAEESGLMVEQVQPAQLEQRVQSLLSEQPAPPAAQVRSVQPEEPLPSALAHCYRYNRDNPNHPQAPHPRD